MRDRMQPAWIGCSRPQRRPWAGAGLWGWAGAGLCVPCGCVVHGLRCMFKRVPSRTAPFRFRNTVQRQLYGGGWCITRLMLMTVRLQVPTPWHPTIKEAWGKKLVRELPEREKDALMTMNPSEPT